MRADPIFFSLCCGFLRTFISKESHQGHRDCIECGVIWNVSVLITNGEAYRCIFIRCIIAASEANSWRSFHVTFWLWNKFDHSFVGQRRARGTKQSRGSNRIENWAAAATYRRCRSGLVIRHCCHRIIWFETFSSQSRELSIFVRQ